MLNNKGDSESRLKAIFDTVLDGIITIDKKGTVESMNPAAAKLFGYTPTEVVGHNVKILMPEPDQSKHDGYLKNYHQTKEKKIIGIGSEVIGKRKDGKTFSFWLRVSEVILEDKTIYTGIIHDLSEQKKTQEKLEKKVASRTKELAQVIEKLQHINKNKEEEIANRKEKEKKVKHALIREIELGELKSRFVSMASHEFRTPLAGILSSTELIELSNSSEHENKRLKYLKQIRESVQSLTAILNDFLSLGKLQEGKTVCNPISFDLLKLAEEMIENMEQIKKPNQTIFFDYTGDREVYQDFNVLKNVFINLISNAIKYSEEGTSIYFDINTDAEQITIRVKDSGIGIPETDQKHLFERFFRAKNATNIQGTGLGLNIVKQYLELMGGTIFFESIENDGTTFKVNLPKQFK
jgi:two-component system sensor kinase FixL